MALFFNFGFEYLCFSEKQIALTVDYMKKSLEMTDEDLRFLPNGFTLTYGVADKTKRIRASLFRWSKSYSGMVFEDNGDFNDIEILISFDSIIFRVKAVKCLSTGALAEIEFPDSIPDSRYSWDWYEQLAYQAGMLLTEKQLIDEFASDVRKEKDGLEIYKTEKEVLEKYNISTVEE